MRWQLVHKMREAADAHSKQHDIQLCDPIDGTHTRMMDRSILGFIYSFNMLPTAVVHAIDASAFQRGLQQAVKNKLQSEIGGWEVIM